MNWIRICDRLKALSAWELKSSTWFHPGISFPTYDSSEFDLRWRKLWTSFALSIFQINLDVSLNFLNEKKWIDFIIFVFFTYIMSCVYLVVCLLQSIFIHIIEFNPFEIIKKRDYIHFVDTETETQQKLNYLFMATHRGTDESTTLRLWFLPLRLLHFDRRFRTINKKWINLLK